MPRKKEMERIESGSEDALTQSFALGTGWVPDEAQVGLQGGDVSAHNTVDLPRDRHLDAVPLP
jgi:hypothetical protein